MFCKYCDEGNEPTVLDIDGVQSSISGQPGIWGHAYEDDWWPCQRKAAEEHAEIKRLREEFSRLREAFSPVQDWYDVEEGGRDFSGMLTDAIADLQQDRKEALESRKLRAEIERLWGENRAITDRLEKVLCVIDTCRAEIDSSGGREVSIRDELRLRQAKVERLQAIVDKLPKTADGVPVVPGINVFRLWPNTALGCEAVREHTVEATHLNGVSLLGVAHSTSGWGETPIPFDQIFSTREAAEAAKGE